MNLYSLIGQNGTGKTLFLTRVAKRFEHIPVYSNFKLFTKNYREFKWYEMFDIPNESMIFIDEAYILADSRNSMNTINKLASYILAFQKRKRMYEVYLTYQLDSTLDLRFRKQSNYVIETVYRFDDFDDFYYYVYLQFKPNQFKLIDIKLLRYEQAEKYFQYFDTNEVIHPLEKRYMQYQIDKKNPKLMKERMNQLVPLSYESIDKITHPEVEYWLFDNDYPVGYEKYLYLSLKHYEKQKIT